MLARKAAIDLYPGDRIANPSGEPYIVKQVLEYAPADFADSDHCIGVEVVTEPRLPIGTEFFTPSSNVTIHI